MRALYLILLGTHLASAATITGMAPVTGAATGGLTALSTSVASNDNVAGPSPNTLAFTLNVNSIGSISHNLINDGMPGVTEYTASVTILNNLAVPITLWAFLLPGTPYDFDSPDFDTTLVSSLGWTPTLWTDQTLRFQGGALAPGQSMSFVFNIDVPAGTAGVAGNFVSVFETGVPEPSTYALTASALALLALRARRARQS